MTTLSDALLSRADHATAAIQWCEPDFAVHPSIAEFYNSLSSLAFCAAGVSMSLQDLRLPLLRSPLRFTGPLVFFLGLASAAYHATLQLSWQRLDEVSENAALVSLLHGALQPAPTFSAFAAHAALASWGVLSVHRFLFTELHLIGAAVALGFALHALGAHAARARPAVRAAVAGRLLVACAAALLGAAAWLVDRLACPHLLQLRINPQLHAWWHLAGAVALHEAFVGAALAGCSLDGEQPRLRVGALGLLSSVCVVDGGAVAAGPQKRK